MLRNQMPLRTTGTFSQICDDTNNKGMFVIEVGIKGKIIIPANRFLFILFICQNVQMMSTTGRCSPQSHWIHSLEQMSYMKKWVGFHCHLGPTSYRCFHELRTEQDWTALTHRIHCVLEKTHLAQQHIIKCIRSTTKRNCPSEIIYHIIGEKRSRKTKPAYVLQVLLI